MLIFANNNTQSNSFSVDDDRDMIFSILESMTELDNLSYSLIENHTESVFYGLKDNNNSILLEGFGDFLKGAADFFRAMIEKIKEYFKKVGIIINAYLGDFKKFLNKNKNYLKTLNPDFKITGYTYSIPDNIPNMTPLEECISSYKSSVGEIAKIKPAEIKAMREQNLSEEAIEKTRAKVLGVTDKISSEDFVTEMRKHFRNGDSEPKEINVTQSLLLDAIASYDKLEKMYKDSCKDRDKMIVLLTKLEDFFKAGAKVRHEGSGRKVEYSDINISDNKFSHGDTKKEADNGSSLKNINIYFNYKYAEAKELSTIISLVLMERSNAIREHCKLTKDIIRKSLTHKDKKGV